MQSLFITATGTNVGKTHTTLQLIQGLSKRGLKVGVYKPIETGVKGLPLDAAALLHACQKVNQNFKHFTTEDITAYTFALPAAPFCADTQHRIEIQHIIDQYSTLRKECDILLVEGAGGLMVPITKDFLMIDLVQKLQTNVLLVTPSRLGCINDTLLSMEALHARHIPFDWCVNLFEEKEHFAQVSQPFYDERFPQWWSVDEGLQRFISTYGL